MKLATEKDIGIYIANRMVELGFKKKVDFANKLSEIKSKEMEGSGTSNYIDLVTKWTNGVLRPGIEHVYVLSRALNVPILEILTAGVLCSKYDDRPNTLYAIAINGDIADLENAIENELHYNTDEFGNDLIHYLLKFERADMIEYLFNNQELESSFYYPRIELKYIDFATITEDNEKIIGMLKLMIRKGKLDVVKYLLGRMNKDSMEKLIQIIKLTDSTILDEMFDSVDILDYYIEPLKMSRQEFSALNNGEFRKEINGKKTDPNMFNSLPYMYNLLLDYAIEIKNKSMIQKLLDIGELHNRAVKDNLYKLEIQKISTNEYGEMKELGGRYREPIFSILAIVKSNRIAELNYIDKNLARQAERMNSCACYM